MVMKKNGKEWFGGCKEEIQRLIFCKLRLLVGKIVGVGAEEIGMERGANGDQQVGVDGGLVEDFLQGAGGDANLFGQPCIGVALSTQFVADDGSYVYRHSGVFF